MHNLEIFNMLQTTNGTLPLIEYQVNKMDQSIKRCLKSARKLTVAAALNFI